MSDRRITPEIEAVLRRSEITATTLKLPSQLERRLYEQVNAVILNAGGKWNRGQKAHVFTSDPRPKLGLALETGVAVDVKKQRQAFYTPAPLAERVAALANVLGKEVLEPSAGGGALARAARRAGAHEIVCVELDEEAAQGLGGEFGGAVQADFLKLTPADLQGQFDRVVMNPPFSKNQDVKHVAHALTFLKPGGILVAIMAPTIHRPSFKALLEAGDSDVIEVPEGAFAESGTKIRTIILKIVKR